MITNFDLHTLGWKAFQDFVGCVLSSVFGQTYQVFSAGPDGGKDGYFRGTWSPKSGESITGRFVVQCKHTIKANSTITKKTINAEIKKIAKLVEANQCDAYVLVTNHELSAPLTAFYEARLISVGVKFPLVFGSDWLNKTISGNPTLRRLVPRLYGLGDLTQILTAQAYAQARHVLDGLLTDLHAFVPTEAYRQSAHAISEQGFVLLLGEPASGKTMIANLLAISAADQWGFQTLMLSSPADFDRLWNPQEPGQFIWVDDAFGATQYDPGRVREWNQRLAKLKAAIHAGAKVVFTSRDYIFRSAKAQLKMSAFELLADAKVTIFVEQLTVPEKQQILYNHLKYGSQPKATLRKVVPFLDAASQVPRFLPEVARRLGSPKFTRSLKFSEKQVVEFFLNPMSVLEDVIENLGRPEQAAIALLFINGGRLPSPISPELASAPLIWQMGTTFGEVITAFDALNGSFLTRPYCATGSEWRFRHPTIADAFASVIGNTAELEQVYLAGVKTERMLSEVTCGDVGVEGAKIIVPAKEFPRILARLEAMAAQEGYGPWSSVTSFLATRCSKEFLELWMRSIENLDVVPSSVAYVASYDASLALMRRLAEFGLLQNHVRLLLVERIGVLARRTRTLDFKKPHIVGCLLTDEESLSIYRDVVEDTIGNVSAILQDIRAEWNFQTDPADAFDDVRSTCLVMKTFGDETEIEAAIGIMDTIDKFVFRMEQERDDATESNDLEAQSSVTASESGVARSIFDDLVD